MSVNTIQTAAVIQSELDKAAVEQATSGWMEVNSNLVKYNGGSEVKMLKADLLVSTGKETSSVTRGDTTISYRDPSASRSATVDFMKNYETSLNHYKKMRLPKDNHAGS